MWVVIRNDLLPEGADPQDIAAGWEGPTITNFELEGQGASIAIYVEDDDELEDAKSYLLRGIGYYKREARWRIGPGGAVWLVQAQPRKRKGQEQKEELPRALFAKLLMERAEGQVSDLKDQRRNTLATIQEYLGYLQGLYQRADDLERELAWRERSSLEGYAALEAQYDSLIDIPGISSIELRAGGGLVVGTEEVLLDGKYEIGNFEIRIDLLRGNVESIRNRDPLVKKGITLHHPHVETYGVCWGNAGHPIVQALSIGHIDQALVMILSFLRTWNHAEIYRDKAEMLIKRSRDRREASP